MKHNFECDQCSKMYSSRQSRWRHKRNDHVIPAKLQRFNKKQVQRKTGGGETSNVTLQKILQNLRQIQRKTGGGTTSDEILQRILHSSHDEPTVEEKKWAIMQIVKK